MNDINIYIKPFLNKELLLNKKLFSNNKSYLLSANKFNKLEKNLLQKFYYKINKFKHILYFICNEKFLSIMFVKKKIIIIILKKLFQKVLNKE